MTSHVNAEYFSLLENQRPALPPRPGPAVQTFMMGTLGRPIPIEL